MTIPLTWPNIYKLAGLVLVILSAVMTAGGVVVDRQIRLLDGRLDDRWHNYQSDQQEVRRRLEYLENKLRVGP